MPSAVVSGYPNMATTEVEAAQQRAVALSMFRQWIINALMSKSRGDGAAYWRLLQEIDQIRADPAKLRVFSQCVSYFDPDVHEALLIQLLGVSLWTCNSDVAGAIIDFCANLASANSACLPFALDILVRNLMPPSSGVPAFMGVQPAKPPAAPAQPGGLAGGAGAVAAILAAKARKGEELRRQGEVVQWVVGAVARISRLVPTASSRLLPLVLQRLPHKRVEKEFQCVYVAGMFALAEAEEGETVRDGFLAAVVDHLIQMDVEIRWEDIAADPAVVGSTDAPSSTDAAAAGAASAAAAGAAAARGASRVYMFHMDLDDAAAAAHHAALSAAADGAAPEAGVPGSEARHGLLPCPAAGAAAAGGSERGGGGSSVGGGTVAGAGAGVDEMAAKMDALMDLTFQHILTRSNANQLPQVYEALIRSFDSTILDTYKSKFTQFLLFFTCSLSPATLAVAFASHLTDILTSPSRSINSRMSAAAYLASFLARASFIPLMHILSALTRVVEWCLAHSHTRHRDAPPGSSGASCSSKGGAGSSSRGREGSQSRAERAAPSPRASRGGGGTGNPESPHSHTLAPSLQDQIFYAACQAVLYVLCYRMQHLAADSQANAALHAMPLTQLVSSHLQPLSVCLESVVFEFSRQARLLGLLDCDAIRAAQQQGEQTSAQGGKEDRGERAAARFGGENELDMFFPFDPYLLHHSLRFIQPIFNQWTQPFADELAAAEDEETDSDEEEEEEDTDDEDEEEGSSSEGEDSAAERLGMSFSASDASPADHLMEQGLRARGRATACQGRGGGRGGGRGRGRGGQGVVHEESDSEDEHEVDAMSFTPPAHAPLPPRLPGKLPSRLR